MIRVEIETDYDIDQYELDGGTEFGLVSNSHQSIESVFIHGQQVAIRIKRPSSSMEEQRLFKPKVPGSSPGAGSNRGIQPRPHLATKK